MQIWGLPEWLFGVLLCLGGSACTNLGLTIQKYSFILDAAKPTHQQRSVVKQPYWLGGFGVFTIGQILSLVAMGFASQAVVATLGSFSLVTNAVFTPLILGEKVTMKDILSILVIVSGSVIVVRATKHHNEDYDLETLLLLYQQPVFVIYTSALVICTFIAYLFYRNHKRDPNRVPTPRSGFTAAAIAAAISSCSVLLGKCSVQLIKCTANGANQFWFVSTYLIIAIFLTAAIASVHFTNAALRAGAALFIIPVYYVMSTLLTIIEGLLYFQEYRQYDLLHGIYFSCGVLLTMIGVWIGAQKDVASSQHEVATHDDVRFPSSSSAYGAVDDDYTSNSEYVDVEDDSEDISPTSAAAQHILLKEAKKKQQRKLKPLGTSHDSASPSPSPSPPSSSPTTDTSPAAAAVAAATLVDINDDDAVVDRRIRAAVKATTRGLGTAESSSTTAANDSTAPTDSTPLLTITPTAATLVNITSSSGSGNKTPGSTGTDSNDLVSPSGRRFKRVARRKSGGFAGGGGIGHLTSPTPLTTGAANGSESKTDSTTTLQLPPSARKMQRAKTFGALTPNSKRKLGRKTGGVAGAAAGVGGGNLRRNRSFHESTRNTARHNHNTRPPALTSLMPGLAITHLMPRPFVNNLHT